MGKQCPVHCPHFPRSKDEGWSLVLGCIDNRELYAIKRVAIRREFSNHHLIFQTPESTGKKMCNREHYNINVIICVDINYFNYS